ncbi:MAG: TolB family protein [Hyphomonadaceae bacterium]
MSADGALIAFTVIDMPESQFVLYEVRSGATWIVEAPTEHGQIGDLAWSPDGDELTFVTAPESVLRGGGQHVWRLRILGSPVVDLLALIPHVRRPVLSADGAYLATLEGVFFEGVRPYAGVVQYALFERSVGDGGYVRRSQAYFTEPVRFQYDRDRNIFLSFLRPVFATEGRWLETGPDGRSGWAWREENRQVDVFRLARGETLAAFPDPWPRDAPAGAQFVRPSDDGRVILRVSFGEANPLAWYDERGRPRRPLQFARGGFIVCDGEATCEEVPAAELPEDAGRTGGEAISADRRMFAQVISRHVPRGVRRAEGPPWDFRHRLLIYDHGTPFIDVALADVLERAERVRAVEAAPLMPGNQRSVHRVESQPPAGNP